MGRVAQRVFKTRAVVSPRLGRFDSGAAPSTDVSCRLGAPAPRRITPPPAVMGVFHGKQPSFCAVAATRKMSANTPTIGRAIKSLLMP